MQQTKRILLIDDDRDHLLLCNLVLRRKGYEVMGLAGCDRPVELTEAVEGFKPHLIFVDHDMRGICGADLVRLLKSDAEFTGIPIVYFTGRDNIAELAKAAGADGYFRKPFTFDGLTEITAAFVS